MENKTTTLSPLKIKIVSDLHIEFYGDNVDSVPDDMIVPKAPILALLGDVGLACTEVLRQFLLYQAGRFEQVLFVAGNHEFYTQQYVKKRTVQEQLDWLKAVCNERDNLHFLEKTVFDTPQVRILGTTLWSYIPPEQEFISQLAMNDYHLSYCEKGASEQPQDNNYSSIRKMTVQDTRLWHQDSVAWLEREIDRAEREDKRVLVLTHHTPYMTGTSHPKYNDSDFHCCFSTDLSHLLLRSPVRVWACGHTHYNFDMLVGRTTRLVSNQRGYPKKNLTGFDRKGLVLEFPECIT